MDWIANARMYAVTPEVEAAWQELLSHVARDAGVELAYVRYPAPAPLEDFWSRPDLGAVFMCGYPVALKLAAVTPIAAPIPHADWSGGRAVYRSDLIVREDSPYRKLEDTFGARAGWTVSHSQSGFNAFRYTLLAHRTPDRPTLYREMAGNLITARNVLDGVREGRIDVGPLDAYWHMLIARHAPQLTRGVRVLTSTPLTPMPPFVAAAGAPPELVTRLRAAFLQAKTRSWFARCAQVLLLDGFAAADAGTFQPLLEWDRAAREAGYELPA
ncbi:MAG TPA: PhnD/SsuA/transferrin family substrate-binding protein [Steroidobacteraceae bacterium]|nr:PhnD/SsuA/transferrin family substrate-binding protein [Steroidobacteraceae bacterium]